MGSREGVVQGPMRNENAGWKDGRHVRKAPDVDLNGPVRIRGERTTQDAKEGTKTDTRGTMGWMDVRWNIFSLEGWERLEEILPWCLRPNHLQEYREIVFKDG